ncbi:hypothetical protein HBH95_102940 [Parastagonospora nodorum]|nr:hypothetical protein HBH95_102940 [Parastagonospora nodorum]
MIQQGGLLRMKVVGDGVNLKSFLPVVLHPSPFLSLPKPSTIPLPKRDSQLAILDCYSPLLPIYPSSFLHQKSLTIPLCQRDSPLKT